MASAKDRTRTAPGLWSTGHATRRQPQPARPLAPPRTQPGMGTGRHRERAETRRCRQAERPPRRGREGRGSPRIRPHRALPSDVGPHLHRWRMRPGPAWSTSAQGRPNGPSGRRTRRPGVPGTRPAAPRSFYTELLHGATAAERWDWINSNPARLTRRPRPKRAASSTRRSGSMTHQNRRIAFGLRRSPCSASTCARVEARLAELGLPFSEDLFAFSNAWPRTTRSPPRPTLSHAKPWRRTLASSPTSTLRRYSATELLTAGVNLPTAVGRLGHGGGSATTLKVYAAWPQHQTATRQKSSCHACQREGSSRHGPEPMKSANWTTVDGSSSTIPFVCLIRLLRAHSVISRLTSWRLPEVVGTNRSDIPFGQQRQQTRAATTGKSFLPDS